MDWGFALGLAMVGIAVPMLWPHRRSLAWVLLVVGCLLLVVCGGSLVWPWVQRWPFESLAVFLTACLGALCFLQRLHYKKMLEHQARQHDDALKGIAEGVKRIKFPSPSTREDRALEKHQEQLPEASRDRMLSGREVLYDGPRLPVVQKTVHQLAEKAAGCTDHEAERLFMPYIGKWLPVEGPVKNARTSRGTFHLTLHDGGSPWVDCEFEPDTVRSVEHLSRGDQVRLVGRIGIATKKGFTLEQCEVF